MTFFVYISVLLRILVNNYIVYFNSTSSTPYPLTEQEEESSASEGSSSNNNNKENDQIEQQESYEIEGELKDIDKKIKQSKNAQILDKRLPHHHKDKNRHLNDLRKDPNVK